LAPEYVCLPHTQKRIKYYSLIRREIEKVWPAMPSSSVVGILHLLQIWTWQFFFWICFWKLWFYEIESHYFFIRFSVIIAISGLTFYNMKQYILKSGKSFVLRRIVDNHWFSPWESLDFICISRNYLNYFFLGAKKLILNIPKSLILRIFGKKR